MSYISQSENNSPWNHAFPARNRETFCIISIVRKESTSAYQVIEDSSSKQLTVKCNRVHIITSRRDKDTIRTNLQKIGCILNQIIHIHPIGNKLISIPNKPPTPDHIGDVVNSLFVSKWYDSIFSNY